MVETTDYYIFLQINPSATQDEVRAAYKRLAFLYHPDRSIHPQATRQMQLLNEAYEVLSDPEKRAQFDQERLSPPPPVSAPEEQTTPSPPKPPDPVRRSQAAHKINEHQLIKLSGWLQSQLKIILSIVGLIILLFLWSLVTGQVNIAALLLLVISALYIILSVIRKIRNPAV